MLLKSDEIYLGGTVYLMWKNPPDAYVWGDVFIPVLIEEEYPRFFVGTVLPHKNAHGSGESHPYRITLNKFDVDARNMVIMSYIG